MKNMNIDKLDDIRYIHITEPLKWILLMQSQVHVLNLIKKIITEVKNLKVHDHIRISKYENIFARGYTPNLSEEVFVIQKVETHCGVDISYFWS